jgi:hypothetical protein
MPGAAARFGPSDACAAAADGSALRSESTADCAVPPAPCACRAPCSRPPGRGPGARCAVRPKPQLSGARGVRLSRPRARLPGPRGGISARLAVRAAGRLMQILGECEIDWRSQATVGERDSFISGSATRFPRTVWCRFWAKAPPAPQGLQPPLDTVAPAATASLSSGRATREGGAGTPSKSGRPSRPAEAPSGPGPYPRRVWAS